MMILPIADIHEKYAHSLEETLRKSGLRAYTEDVSQSLGKRIRAGEKQRIPYMLVIGDREMESDAVTVRSVKTKKQITVSAKEFLKKTIADVKERRLDASFE